MIPYFAYQRKRFFDFCLEKFYFFHTFFGVISAAGLGLLYKKLSPSNYTEAGNLGLAEEIRKAREKAKGIIGVNVMVALSDFAELVKTSIAEKVDINFQRCRTAFGLAFFPQER